MKINLPAINITKDMGLRISALIFVVLEFLPVVNVLPVTLISMLKLLTAAVFFLNILLIDRGLLVRLLLALTGTIVVNIWAFYQLWVNYTTIGSFLIRSTLCWVYIELGFCLYLLGSQRTKRLVFYVLLALVLITGATTILSVIKYPTAVRELGNGSKNIEGLEKTLYARNTATWGCMYGFTFFLPALIDIFRKKRNYWYLAVILFVEFCIIQSQITMAVLLSFVFLVFLVFKPISWRYMVIASVFIICIGGVLLFFMDDILLFIYNLMSSSGNGILRMRVYQMYQLFAESKLVGTIGSRIELYTASFKTFLQYPLVGYHLRDDEVYTVIGMHSQILDLMAGTGLAGIGIMAFVYLRILNKVQKAVRDVFSKRFFILAMFLLFVLMLANPTYYAPCIYLVAFMGPSFADSYIKHQR